MALLLCRPGICWLFAVFPSVNSLFRSPANSYLKKTQLQPSQGFCLLLILQALAVLSLYMRALLQKSCPQQQPVPTPPSPVFHLILLQQQHHPAVKSLQIFHCAFDISAPRNRSCSNEVSTFSGRLLVYTKPRLPSATEPLTE